MVERRNTFHAVRKWLRPALSSDGAMSAIQGHIVVDYFYDKEGNIPDTPEGRAISADLSFRDCYRQVTYNMYAYNQKQAAHELSMLRKLRDEINEYVERYEEAATHLPRAKKRRDSDVEEDSEC